MYDPHRRVSARCTGKVRFNSPAVAYEVAHRRDKGRCRTRKERRPARDVYRCPDCGGWHLGVSRDL